jgi:hypothetical protein
MTWDEIMDQWLAWLPPPPEERRRILEPLTERQLARSFRQVRLDRHDHVLAKHSKTAYPLPWHAVGLMERLAEEPRAYDWRPMFIYVLSDAVSDYWSHLNEGHLDLTACVPPGVEVPEEDPPTRQGEVGVGARTIDPVR